MSQGITEKELTLLTDEFNDEKIGVKVQSLSKARDKALLVLYIQHTYIAERLDLVDPNWNFSCERADRRINGQDTLTIVKGSLTVLGVTRENFGEGEDEKSAASDCLKRCAMLFGVARYLYDQPMVWVAYNEPTDRYKQWTLKDYTNALGGPTSPSTQKTSQGSNNQTTKPISDSPKPHGATPGCKHVNTMPDKYDTVMLWCFECKKKVPQKGSSSRPN